MPSEERSPSPCCPACPAGFSGVQRVFGGARHPRLSPFIRVRGHDESRQRGLEEHALGEDAVRVTSKGL